MNMSLALNDICTGKELSKDQYEGLGMTSPNFLAQSSNGYTDEEQQAAQCVEYDIDNTRIQDSRSKGMNLNCFTDYTLQYDQNKNFLGFRLTTSQGYESQLVMNSQQSSGAPKDIGGFGNPALPDVQGCLTGISLSVKEN